MRIFISLLAAFWLLGCGVKGPIYLPEAPEQQNAEKPKNLH